MPSRRIAPALTSRLRSRARTRSTAICGLAYVASNRMSEAVDAFSHATSDGTYRLSPEAQASFDAARKAVAQLAAKRPSETDALLAAAGYGGTYDPLDPTGESGELIPSADEHGLLLDFRGRHRQAGCA